jgi:DNA-binding PadR family transcriptional regulator
MGEGDYSAKALMALMGLLHRPTFLYDYLHPAVAGGWLELTRPETPKSPKQGYRLTASGRQLLLELGCVTEGELKVRCRFGSEVSILPPWSLRRSALGAPSA